jgi:hypothetical protein
LVPDIKENHRLRVFENRLLRRIFESKRDEVTGSWRELHDEELHNLYSSPTIIIMIKSRWRYELAGHVARMGRDEKTRKKETTRKTWTKVGRKILKWILGKWDDVI